MELSDKIRELHRKETDLNKEITSIDKEIRHYNFLIKKLTTKKEKIALHVSRNVKYRNELIHKLNPTEHLQY